MRMTISVCLLVMALAGQANAQAMTPILPGVMCETADALGRLTLNDGSSRSNGRKPSQEALAIMARGGCASTQPGKLVERRKNTSVILADPEDGKGVRRFYVPNIIYSLTVDNLPALRANPAVGNLPPDCVINFDRKITVDAIIRSDMFSPDTGKPYRYHYLFFPEGVCVEGSIKGQFEIANAVSLKPLEAVSPGTIVDGKPVRAVGRIGIIEAGVQPLTLDFLADSVMPR